MDSVTITVLAVMVSGILVFFMCFTHYALTTPPELYPSDRKKYRIKEVVLKRGVSDYYVQYKRFFFWLTYKIEVPRYNNEWLPSYKKKHFSDIDSAKAKITELIDDRQRADGEKKDKVKYHYS
jgi:hypothetical protein